MLCVGVCFPYWHGQSSILCENKTSQNLRFIFLPMTSNSDTGHFKKIVEILCFVVHLKASVKCLPRVKRLWCKQASHGERCSFELRDNFVELPQQWHSLLNELPEQARDNIEKRNGFEDALGVEEREKCGLVLHRRKSNKVRNKSKNVKWQAPLIRPTQWQELNFSYSISQAKGE